MKFVRKFIGSCFNEYKLYSINDKKEKNMHTQQYYTRVTVIVIIFSNNVLSISGIQVTLGEVRFFVKRRGHKGSL